MKVLSPEYILGTILGPGHKAGNEVDVNPCPPETYILVVILGEKRKERKRIENGRGHGGSAVLLSLVHGGGVGRDV